VQIPVLIEPTGRNGYVARAGAPFNWSAEGATPDEAVEKLRQEASRRLAAGAAVAAIDVPDGGHPFAPLVGSLNGHPLLDEWRQAMADARRAEDGDPGRD
jgi:hypothetical protein